MSLMQTFEKTVKREFDKAVSDITKDLKAACPVDTGVLKNSIHATTTGRYEAFIGSDYFYIKYADQGNGPGIIYPKRKTRLKFKGKDGQWHYVKSVKPYKGTGFIKKVAESARNKYE